MSREILRFLFVLVLMVFVAGPAAALDDEHRQQANASIDRGIAYLRTTQLEDGSWSPQAGPAVTGLVVTAMLDRPDISEDDPAVARAISYILSKVNEDGSIHSGILANYNTAICLSALSRISHREDIVPIIVNAQNFLRGLQWQVGMTDPNGKPIDENHPFYGGAGYGQHGRPDLSNTQIMLQGLRDSGVDCDDPAFGRAIAFVSRLQGSAGNDLFTGDEIEKDGGFIYATSVSKDHIGVPQSMANPEMVEAANAGQPVSGLRSYGSMTYAGFKSYIYAMPDQIGRQDSRVVDAWNWIRENYTVEHNPGLPESIRHHGLYYYYVTFARTLSAWGQTHVETADGQQHDWANDLIAKLVSLQRENGSWVNEADRWMEGDVNLVTAYALLALVEAVR